MNDLNFDTNGDGRTDSIGDTYWNSGAGWQPIGGTFSSTFRGNGHVIRNLFINRESTTNVGLFSIFGGGLIEQLGLTNVQVTGERRTGSLAGNQTFVFNAPTIIAVYATGRVSGNFTVGGLVGQNAGGNITASYAAVAVSARGSNFGSNEAGGLVGSLETNRATITASYATGTVTGPGTNVGGLVGLIERDTTITTSYWDTTSSRIADDTDDNAPEGKTTAELQAPTSYTGIYANWNVNVDGETGNDNPWAFGTSSHYPVLRYGRTQAQINAQFEAQPGDAPFAAADIDQNYEVNEQDALLMVRTYLPGVQGAGVTAAEQARAEAWQENGRAVGGDLNNDGDINEQDALIMYYAYQFRALLQNSAVLRQRLFNGLRGSGRRQMPDTDETYREFLRRALRLR